MVCRWKRCRTETGLMYCGIGLCHQHWRLLGGWIERLESGGRRLTPDQAGRLLARSIKRGNKCPQRTT